MPLYCVELLNKFPPENIWDKASKLLYANGNFYHKFKCRMVNPEFILLLCIEECHYWFQVVLPVKGRVLCNPNCEISGLPLGLWHWQQLQHYSQILSVCLGWHQKTWQHHQEEALYQPILPVEQNKPTDQGKKYSHFLTVKVHCICSC